MSANTSSFLSEKYLEIIEKIKGFTFKSPSNRGIADPSYKSYLAKCSRLFSLDMQLNDLCNTYDFDDPDHFKEIEEVLFEIAQEVDKLVK